VEIFFVKFDNFLKVVKFAKKMQPNAGTVYIDLPKPVGAKNFKIGGC
jgi:hypothetical protein